MITACGILPVKYDTRDWKYKVFICHPGGPYFKRPDKDWCIAKGQMEDGEYPDQTASREFAEETGVKIEDLKPSFMFKHEVQSRSRKLVKCYYFFVEKDIDLSKCYSNTFVIDGKTYPEMNEYKWVTLDEARDCMVSYQVELIDKLEKYLNEP